MAQPHEINNVIVTTSAARTATFNSDTFRYVDFATNACNIVIDVTAASGTSQTLTAQLQGFDVATGKWYNIPWAVTASITGVSTTLLSVGQGLTGVANSVINAVLPNTLRLVYTIGGTTPSFTFAAGVTFTA